MIRGKRGFAKIDRVMRLLALITMEKMMVSAMWKGTRMVRNLSSMGELVTREKLLEVLLTGKQHRMTRFLIEVTKEVDKGSSEVSAKVGVEKLVKL